MLAPVPGVRRTPPESEDRTAPLETPFEAQGQHSPEEKTGLAGKTTGIAASDPLAKAAELAQLVVQAEQIVPCTVQRRRPLRPYVTHIVLRWESAQGSPDSPAGECE